MLSTIVCWASIFPCYVLTAVCDVFLARVAAAIGAVVAAIAVVAAVTASFLV
jgi:hypothetical protein